MYVLARDVQGFRAEYQEEVSGICLIVIQVAFQIFPILPNSIWFGPDRLSVFNV